MSLIQTINYNLELINPLLLDNLYVVLINKNNYNYINSDTYYYICFNAINLNPFLLKYVSYYKLNNINNYYNICYNAIKKNGLMLDYVKNIFNYNKYLKLCLLAVKNIGLSIRSIINKFKTYKICLSAVTNDGLALIYIKNQNYNLCYKSVLQNGLTLEYINIKFHTYEIYNNAVCNNGLALKFVKNQTYELCYNAIITYNNNNTLYIPDQHPFKYINFNIFSDNEIYKLALLSIKKDSRIIIYFNKNINNLSLINKNKLIKLNKFKLLNLYKKAIINNSSCIKYIIPKYQTIKLCLLSLKDDINNLKFINNKSEQLYIKIVKNNGLHLEFLNYQTEDICYNAILNNHNAFKFVKNITYTLCIKLIENYKYNNYNDKLIFNNIINNIKQFNNNLLIDILTYILI
jgi:hypothetical protein